MKINIIKDFFNINPLFFVTFIFFLIAIFYSPALVNFFYLILLTLFIYKVYIKEINLNINFNISFILQIIFCSYLILNSFILNEDISISYKSLFYFRFFLAAYIISIILIKNDHTLSYISLIFMLCSIFLSIDIIYQSQTGRDFFGFEAGLCSYPNGSWEIDPKFCERFSGFFGSEYIAGTFLSTYGLFFLYLFFNKLKKTITVKFFIFLFLILILISIIITGERNAFLGVIIIFAFNLLFNKKIRKYLFFTIITFLLILSLSFKKFEHVKHRYVSWPVSVIESKDGNIFKKLLQTPWGNHYLTSYEIFTANKLFGSGFKSFRNECKKNNYSFEQLNIKYDLKLKYSGCSTHPHNMYLEILTETGIVGFIIFLMIIYFILFNPYIKNIKYFKDKELVIFTLSIIASILFPLKPTGSFSSTIFSTNIWFFIGFYLYFVNNLKYKK
tara:strand:- start:1371 stop:2702 length:1332 start_codon:yes stop_codon:yes gene_type:complete